MSNTIMNITLPGVTKNPVRDNGLMRVAQKEKASFSKYVEKKYSEVDEKKSMLGVKKNGMKPVDKEMPENSKSDSGHEIASAAKMMQELLAKLKELASDKESGVGEWQISEIDPGFLENLAEMAGMDAEQLTALTAQMEDQGGVVSMLDLLAALENHFKQLDKDIPVLAPETDLPLLETLLSKIGIPVEDINKISAASVNDLGEFDLELFLQGLKDIDGDIEVKAAPLTDWELEQLQNMLAEAGMTNGNQHKLLTGHYLNLQNFLSGKNDNANLTGNEPGANLDLEGLKELLEQTIADAKSDNPKADVPAFLNQLGKILGQAGFKDQGVGWSPVVQEAVGAIYNELQKLMEQNKIRVEKVSELMTENEALTSEWLDSGKIAATFDEAAVAIEKIAETLPASPEVVEDSSLKSMPASEKSEFDVASLSSNGNSEEVKIAEVIENKTTPRMRIRPEIQQFAFDQISHSVMRGLKNSQHQLTLTLYPKELGEVKVEMQVKENQVSLSFLMENPKVKELLESNMQDFRNSMEQRGFVLHGCDVSVDQNNDKDGNQQMFELAQQKGMSEKERMASLAELTELVAAEQSSRLASHDGQISVMV